MLKYNFSVITLVSELLLAEGQGRVMICGRDSILASDIGWSLLNLSLRPNEYAKRLEPRFRLIVPSHWQTQKQIKKIQRSVRGGYYTALVVHDLFVLFTLHLLKRKLK